MFSAMCASPTLLDRVQTQCTDITKKSKSPMLSTKMMSRLCDSKVRKAKEESPPKSDARQDTATEPKDKTTKETIKQPRAFSGHKSWYQTIKLHLQRAFNKTLNNILQHQTACLQHINSTPNPHKVKSANANRSQSTTQSPAAQTTKASSPPHNHQNTEILPAPQQPPFHQKKFSSAGKERRRGIRKTMFTLRIVT